jgi:hypothetical protein
VNRALPPIAGLHVGQAKLVDYLLDPSHPAGRSKAAFLERFGFRRKNASDLADALAEHILSAPAAQTIDDPDGSTRLICEGALRGLDGRMPRVRTVWIMEDDGYARFITLVPLGKRGTGFRVDPSSR